MQKLNRRLKKFFFVFAGGENYWEILPKAGVDALLFSFYNLQHLSKEQTKAYFLSCIYNDVRIMVDSGAFSAYKKGISIDLKAYADWQKTWSDYIWAAVNLDEIRRPDVTQANYDTLCELGVGSLLPILTVHHQYEKQDENGRDILGQMLEEIQPYKGQTYVGISPEDGAHWQHIRNYLFECLPILNMKKPYHVHIFGLGYTRNLVDFVSALDPSIRVSADARTYAIWAERRELFLPSGRRVGVGTRNHSGDHVLALPKIEQIDIAAQLEEAGLRWDDVTGDDSKNIPNISYFNALSLMKIQERLNESLEYSGSDEMDLPEPSSEPEQFGE